MYVYNVRSDCMASTARVHPKLTLGSDFLIMQKIVSLTIVVNIEKCLNVRFEDFLYVNTVLKR